MVVMFSYLSSNYMHLLVSFFSLLKNIFEHRQNFFCLPLFQNCFDIEKLPTPAQEELSEVSIPILDWQNERTAPTWIHLLIKQQSYQNQIESNLNIRGEDTFYRFAYQITQMSIISPKEHAKSFLHTLLSLKGSRITKLSY